MLLNPKNFEIDEEYNEDVEGGAAACQRLIEKWTPQLENEMLLAFIKLYYDEMYQQWGPACQEEAKAYWPEIKCPADLLRHTGTDVILYALEDAIYAKSKTEAGKYETQIALFCCWNVPGTKATAGRPFL